jgi:hypothetical protein
MLAYYDPDWESTEARTLPYAPGGKMPDSRYYNFRERPDLIPHVLEDFQSFAHYPAVQRFYGMLAWINGPDSDFESSDSRLKGPRPATMVAGQDGRQEVVCGLMFFLRDLRFNLSAEHRDYYVTRLLQVLGALAPTSAHTRIMLSLRRCDFLALPGPAEAQRGMETLATIVVLGEGEAELMSRLDQAVEHFACALQTVSGEIRTSLSLGR